MLLSVTVDHDIIRSWAQRRNAQPMVSRPGDRPGPLMFVNGPPDASLTEMSWPEFFAAFDRGNLAFVYRDAAPDGALDDLHEFVSRASVPELTEALRTTIIERVA